MNRISSRNARAAVLQAAILALLMAVMPAVAQNNDGTTTNTTTATCELASYFSLFGELNFSTSDWKARQGGFGKNNWPKFGRKTTEKTGKIITEVTQYRNLGCFCLELRTLK